MPNSITVILHVKYLPSVDSIELEVDSVMKAAGLYKKYVSVNSGHAHSFMS